MIKRQKGTGRTNRMTIKGIWNQLIGGMVQYIFKLVDGRAQLLLLPSGRMKQIDRWEGAIHGKRRTFTVCITC
jgi:hypothetical protein